ncbi:6737_t:CDS:2 [Gigaspora margarita]|uniref:6737_t:CDS:1 n=1 Tax=Gigaspora margarita TaxID=4874 RepID=A0ABM8W063_GIGMA|nr:6737_t:CDS:2 [Gigaspora margarita]
MFNLVTYGPSKGIEGIAYESKFPIFLLKCSEVGVLPSSYIISTTVTIAFTNPWFVKRTLIDKDKTCSKLFVILESPFLAQVPLYTVFILR